MRVSGQVLAGKKWTYRSVLLVATALPLVGMATGAHAQDTTGGEDTTDGAELAPVTVRGQLVEGGSSVADPGTVLISSEQIDAEQPQSIKELFRDTPEVTVSGGSSAAQAISVHGLDEAMLNVTVDGAAQNNSVWHHNGDLTIDPAFLKQAAVYPGVAPADAGFGALGGSVLFETKDAKDMLLPGKDYGATLITSYDTDSDTFNSTLSGYGTYNGLEGLAMITRRKGDDYTNGKGDEEAGTAANMVGGLGKIAYESESGHRVEASGEYLKDSAMRRLRPNMGVVNTDLLPNTAERTTVTLGYETTEAHGWFDPEVKLYYNLATLDRPNENNYTRASGDFFSSTQGIGGKAQNTFALDTEALHKGAWTLGMDFYNEDRFIERYHMTTDADEQEWQVGLYNQLRISPIEGLDISAGVRLDYQHYAAADGQSFDKVGASPSISAEYSPLEWLTLFGGYSYVWGGIDNSDFALYHARDYTYDSDIRATRSQNARIGFRVEHRGLGFETALFRTVVQDPLTYDSSAQVISNGDRITSQGLDIGASYTQDNARISVNYTHTDTDVGDRDALPSDYGYVTPVGDLVTIAGQYTIEQMDLTLGGSTEIATAIDTQALEDAGFEKIDGYTVFNLFTEWTPEAIAPHLTVRFEANNIFNQDYYTRSTYSSTARVTPVYEQGRSFMISSTMKF